MLDNGECPEAVHFQFVNPIGIIERQAPASQRHGLESNRHLLCFYNNSRSDVPHAGISVSGSAFSRWLGNPDTKRRPRLITGATPKNTTLIEVSQVLAELR